MRENWIKSCGLATAAALFAASAANAQYMSGFEEFVGSPAGTITTGSGGYYLPVAGSVDHNIYTYAGNVLGLPQNPVGGLQFNGGTRDGGNARAQRDVSFSGLNQWTVSYDIAATIDTSVGAGGAAYIGSFSLQDSAAVSGYIQIFDWTDRLAPDTWQSYLIAYDAAGAQVFFSAPSAAFENLDQNHWYRTWTTFDLATNEITEMSIVDLTTGHGDTVALSGVYLQGGSNAAAFPDPTGFRMFTGGSDGNVTAWDNMSIVGVPAPSALALLGLGGLVATRRRR